MGSPLNLAPPVGGLPSAQAHSGGPPKWSTHNANNSPAAAHGSRSHRRTGTALDCTGLAGHQRTCSSNENRTVRSLPLVACLFLSLFLFACAPWASGHANQRRVAAATVSPGSLRETEERLFGRGSLAARLIIRRQQQQHHSAATSAMITRRKARASPLAQHHAGLLCVCKSFGRAARNSRRTGNSRARSAHHFELSAFGSEWPHLVLLLVPLSPLAAFLSLGLSCFLHFLPFRSPFRAASETRCATTNQQPQAIMQPQQQQLHSVLPMQQVGPAACTTADSNIWRAGRLRSGGRSGPARSDARDSSLLIGLRQGVPRNHALACAASTARCRPLAAHAATSPPLWRCWATIGQSPPLRALSLSLAQLLAPLLPSAHTKFVPNRRRTVRKRHAYTTSTRTTINWLVTSNETFSRQTHKRH